VSAFRFAEPGAAHLFWALAAGVLLVAWLERRGGADLARFVGTALQASLVSRPAAWRRRLRLGLLALSAAFAIVALMRPQWGMRYVVTPSVSAEIMICLDVSRSMLAEDVPPTRLERAKAEITDLLAYLDGDQVGLIAFAGRATVLSPMTPDFGFLRLVLDAAGPHSVTRGGTRLEEPLRKALAGFGPPGQASRTILLITDGEDHDSFPLDAAKAAAEVGVRIIAIGFGDEAGSEVRVRDPETGVRSVLRDFAGAPVRSRLDGELLRELALTTGGAYVPAGTGVLDLESIYNEHIARLVRAEVEGRGRTQRDEVYGWAVLASLILLLASAGIAARSAAPALLVCLALFAPLPANAADPDSPLAESAALEERAPVKDEEQAPVEDAAPREIYNRGLTSLEAGDFEEAERWLGRARRGAKDDGELRQRASYNLGLVASARASASEPQEALGQLDVAAGWFRRAVELDPEDDDARHNLEVTLRRALILSDELARQDEADLAARLGELAERQRAQTGAVAGLLGAGGRDERHAFRELATAQRTVLSDADALGARTADERDALGETPEDEMRGVQLSNVLHYLHRARERMGQTRRQLRERQGERAYRRSAAALDELKRAIDQLGDPLAALDAVVRETTRIAVETGMRSEGSLDAPAPAWLTPEYLAEGQRSVAERAAELGARLRAGLDAPTEDPEQARLLEAVREAEPLVERGRGALASAADALELRDLPGAMTYQREAVLALLAARERFLDLRGLIEAAHAEQANIGVRLESGEGAELSNLQRAQHRNLERAGRLDAEIARERQASQEQGRATVEPEEGEVFESASTLLELARGEMGDAAHALDQGELDAARAPAERARKHLASLRRLFFSIVDHLRETAAEQVQLGDETRDAAALEQDTAPLVPRQERLGSRAGEIAAALEEQSRAEGGPEEPGDAAEKSRVLRQAGEHVLAAQSRMGEAGSSLEAKPADAQTAQAKAVEELAAAVALLSPPEQQPDEPQQEQQQEQEARPGESDPAQLLQEVRDREAQRRRERARRSGYETVEKDW
jgi:Ca-activated chloride channel family protein